MATDTPHSMHVVVANPANVNQLWETLWSEKEPGNAANGQTFGPGNRFRRRTGPAGPYYVIHTRCTATQKAEMEEYMSGTNPARWLLERTAAQLNTWRSEIDAIAYDQPNHAAWVDAQNLEFDE